MNVILLFRHEINRPLPRSDYRAIHLINTLGARAGRRYRAGIIQGAVGTLIIEAVTEQEIRFRFLPSTGPTAETDSATMPLALLIGHPRPSVARRLVADLSALGVAEIHFFIGQNSERSYRRSHIWHDGVLERMAIRGAEQAGVTAIPTLHLHATLSAGLKQLAHHAQYAAARWLYVTVLQSEVTSSNERWLHSPPERGCSTGATAPFIRLPAAQPLVVAVGAERGWTASEIALLTTYRSQPHTLGPRILRTATAAIAVSTLVAQRYFDRTDASK